MLEKLNDTPSLKSITPQFLIKMGFEGKRIGEIIKLSKTWSKEQIEEFLNTGKIARPESVKIVEHSVWHWLCFNPLFKNFLSASNSEKRRWLEDKAVVINNENPEPDDLIIWFFPIKSLIFFPSAKNKITML